MRRLTPFLTTGAIARTLSAQLFAARNVFVRFSSTPNETCYKFYVDSLQFLPDGAHTMLFDRGNSHQSPLAEQILSALPMVEDVTIGLSFITVRRVEEINAAAAARYFAAKFEGTPNHEDENEEEAAERSQRLQQQAERAMAEDDELHKRGAHEGSMRAPSVVNVATTTSGESSMRFVADTTPQRTPENQRVGSQDENPSSFNLGGFTITKDTSEQDEKLDAAAIQDLIAAMDWSELKLHVSALITDHLSSGEPHIAPDAPHPHADTLPVAQDSEVVLMIKELVVTTIRPQLQEDGGDIRFVGFDVTSGVMKVEMLGACRSCKSSATTLMDLIERTTRHWIPEVLSVCEVKLAASDFEKYIAEHEEEMWAQAQASCADHLEVDEDKTSATKIPEAREGACFHVLRTINKQAPSAREVQAGA